MKRADISYRLMELCIKSVICTLYDIHVQGRENLPKGRSIIVSNHVNYLDPFFIIFGLKHPKPMQFLTIDFTPLATTYSGKLKYEALNTYLRFASQIPLKNGELLGEKNKAIEVLEQNRYLGVFPEGERSHTGELTKFGKGAAFLAMKTKTPITPIHLKGSYEIWPRGTTIPRHYGDVHINVGAPIYPPEPSEDNRKDRTTLTQTVKQEISHLSNTHS